MNQWMDKWLADSQLRSGIIFKTKLKPNRMCCTAYICNISCKPYTYNKGWNQTPLLNIRPSHWSLTPRANKTKCPSRHSNKLRSDIPLTQP